jgi:hypothetical protein
MYKMLYNVQTYVTIYYNHIFKELVNIILQRSVKNMLSLLAQSRHGFSVCVCGGGGGGGGAYPPRNDLYPPKAFGNPANYIYFDLIVSYLIILTTKLVKLPILWSQISPCRPRKKFR